MPFFTINSRMIISVVILVCVQLILHITATTTPANPSDQAQRASLSFESMPNANHKHWKPRSQSSDTPRPAAAAVTVDFRSLPSPLPKHHRNASPQQVVTTLSEQPRPQSQAQVQAREQQDDSMRFDESQSNNRLANNYTNSPSRRPAPEGAGSSADHVVVQKKRFKTSGRFSSISRETKTSTPSSINENIDLMRSNNDTFRSHQSRSATATSQSHKQDLNNNSIETEPVRSDWRQNVNSINGTVDLSRYSQDDVDRLYGDALLVYVKNFNETLPARREVLSINGTTTSDRIPIYKSVSTNK